MSEIVNTIKGIFCFQGLTLNFFLLIRQIERKWGGSKSDVKDRLNKINSSDELEGLGEKIIISECMDDIFSNE